VSPRGTDWRAVGGGCAAGAGLLAVGIVLADDAPLLVLLRVALVPLAAAAAFVLDEPAAAAVDAAPRTRGRRTADRAVAAAMPLLVWISGVVALEARAPVTPAGGLLVEGAGVLAVTVALAAVLRRAGQDEPGEVAASVVGGAVLALQVFDLPSWWPIPLFPVEAGWPASTALWSGLIVAAAAVVVVASADPYRWPTRRAVARPVSVSGRSTVL
jgi:hypothetical protein